MFSKIAAWDDVCMRYFLAHRFSACTDKWLRRYVRLGDGYIWALVVLYVIVHYGLPFFLSIVVRVLISIAICLALYWLMKLTVKRRRPFDCISEVRALVPPLDKYSFPSGHTMNNLAIAATVCAFAPEAGCIMILLPLTWGLLRVYFGVHWISDVIGGFFLGILSFVIATVLWHLFGASLTSALDVQWLFVR